MTENERIAVFQIAAIMVISGKKTTTKQATAEELYLWGEFKRQVEILGEKWPQMPVG